MSSRRWAEKIGQCAALLGALTELLGSVYFAVFNKVDVFSLTSGNLNLGAAILAMFGECCDDGHGGQFQGGGSPSGPPDRPRVVILFMFAGAFNFGAAEVLFYAKSAVVMLAWILSGLSFAFQLIAVGIIASSAQAQPSALGTSQTENQNRLSF